MLSVMSCSPRLMPPLQIACSVWKLLSDLHWLHLQVTELVEFKLVVLSVPSDFHVI